MTPPVQTQPTEEQQPERGWFHVHKEDLHSRSARDIDPPFAAFDVVLRGDYEALADAYLAQQRVIEAQEKALRRIEIYSNLDGRGVSDVTPLSLFAEQVHEFARAALSVGSPETRETDDSPRLTGSLLTEDDAEDFRRYDDSLDAETRETE